MTSQLPSQRAPGTQLGQVVTLKNLDDITTAVTTCTHRGRCTGRELGQVVIHSQATPGTPASPLWKRGVYFTIHLYCIFT